MNDGPTPVSSVTSTSGSDSSDWQFLQCFGERTPGEDIQEGENLDI